jgi:hypothetical protein
MKVVIREGFIWIFGPLYMPRQPTMERGEVIAAWRRAIELSLGDEDAAKLRSIAQSRTEPASRVERARILLAYREDPSFFAVGPGAAPSDRPALRRAAPWWKARWLRSTIVPVPVGNRRSRAKPKPNWCPWPVRRRRTWATPTNCGRRGFSPAMPASTDRRRGTPALPIWHRAQFAKSSTAKPSNRPKCDTTWNNAIPILRKRWPRCCAFIAK